MGTHGRLQPQRKSVQQPDSLTAEVPANSRERFFNIRGRPVCGETDFRTGSACNSLLKKTPEPLASIARTRPSDFDELQRSSHTAGRDGLLLRPGRA